jgi:transcriptional regulator of acetoin/glycerol metabolism
MIDSAVVRHAAEISRVVQGLPGSGATELEDTIIRSWTRCTNDYRIDPVSHAKPNVIDQAAVRERLDQHEDLVTIAAAEMDVLFDQIGASGNALLLTDASGVILHARVDPTLSDMFRGAGLLLGADWSERSEGTNGMGTCIAEGKPVTVHRAEHFRAHHTGLSCTAAPIRNSAGEVIAVLDASCVGATDSRTSQMHMVALVKLSAQVIEKCFFLRSHQRHGVLRFHYRPELVNVLHDGALALAGDGTVIAADYTAVRLLGVQDRYALVGRPVNQIFDARIDEFLPLHAHGGDDLWSVRDVRGGHRYFVSLHSAGCGIRADQLAPPALRPRTVVRLPSTKLATHAATLEELAGEDPQMLRNVRSARRIVDSGVAVLLQGPTGSGKEAFALAMHQDRKSVV